MAHRWAQGRASPGSGAERAEGARAPRTVLRLGSWAGRSSISRTSAAHPCPVVAGAPARLGGEPLPPVQSAGLALPVSWW